ncbi:MAG TPA: signal recognition particle subunit SRP19/SEC65 family protein [Candidatus Thermoplasmatota archaeon]|nr:signal recognition particle subunit SRP19/SEC65 family protein [Candidatus Thermoplasmatota archaeon]
MVSKGADRFALWPRYFDRSLSRSQGRRVPEKVAIKGPDSAWVEAAARKLGLDPQREERAKHPGQPMEASGRVLVLKKGAKEAILQQVALRMRESQDQNQR